MRSACGRSRCACFVAALKYSIGCSCERSAFPVGEREGKREGVKKGGGREGGGWEGGRGEGRGGGREGEGERERGEREEERRRGDSEHSEMNYQTDYPLPFQSLFPPFPSFPHLGEVPQYVATL